MWEWRIFSKDRILLNLDENIFSDAFISDRVDRYFLLEDLSIGAKIRDVEGDNPIFEIKCRFQIKRGLESWEKIVDKLFNKTMTHMNLGKIIKKFSDEEINQFFSERNIPNDIKSLDVRKIQQKTASHNFNSNFSSFWIEKAELEINGNEYHSICLESNSINTLNDHKSIVGYYENMFTGNYPEFLQELV